MQYNLSKLEGLDVIAANDSVIVDIDDNILKIAWDDLHFKLNCVAVKLNCELVCIKHIDNFQPPAFDRKYYDTLLFKSHS